MYNFKLFPHFTTIYAVNCLQKIKKHSKADLQKQNKVAKFGKFFFASAHWKKKPFHALITSEHDGVFIIYFILLTSKYPTTTF